MKKVKLTTEKVLAAYNVLKGASYQKMGDDDKIKLWKIAREMKPIATKFEDDSKDAAEKMKPEGFDEQLQNAQEYERVTKDADADASKLKMGAAEYNEFIKTVQDYNKLVSKAIKDFADKDVVLAFEPLSDDAFCKLMASNDFKVEQTIILGDIIN